MSSKSDDLEKVLKQNLKLRRELAAELNGTNEPNRGWGVLYWVALVLIPVFILCGVAFAFHYLG